MNKLDTKIFDGRAIRNQILDELKSKISSSSHVPVLAVFLVGDDPVSTNYVAIKQKIAEKLGIQVRLFHFPEYVSEKEIIDTIIDLNNRPMISGIMVQIPLPKGIDRDNIIRTIDPAKDVDGLRYCLGLESGFLPPVVLAIEKAMAGAGANLETMNTLIIGQGFLVGNPLVRYLHNKYEKVRKLTILSKPVDNLTAITTKADIIISAVGKAGLIGGNMIKAGAILIDAGTSEIGGELKGDIDQSAYDKAAFITPVPGGIGPVTVAMLMQNLLENPIG
ncbi:MAG: bifunctional 5,10-methylenetetrahydrofolate dehydrogenase/5,10-methenyltetrahydrofolate cyclohydrolase [Patescibacteria group bacterium]|jgi:methylenetetrahydrofolate dehydrogenase (NADP+)/methenyltetrahydrofolate cyclohydrolase